MGMCGCLGWNTLRRLCAHELTFPSVFTAVKNDDDMNYKRSRCMKLLVFALRRSLCWFSLNCIDKSAAFCNNSE